MLNVTWINWATFYLTVNQNPLFNSLFSFHEITAAILYNRYIHSIAAVISFLLFSSYSMKQLSVVQG